MQVGDNFKQDDSVPDVYRFTLLREEAVDDDLFEDKTHDRIADTLSKIIKTEKGGVTVGLEGVWGAGKSAVISILRKKLEKKKNIHIFSFDAWAHEGDPLRRIFLESLMESFPDKNEALKKLQSKIAKRLITKKITSTKSATLLGKLLAIATFFVPLGLALMNKVNFAELTFKGGGEPHWFFLISLFSIVAPLLVISGYAIFLWWSKSFKGIFRLKNWPFMQGESTEDIKQEVSEDDERSSIEFQQYFHKIMEILFDNNSTQRLVMVIDNLDRIDTEDSLKIWSTLQTFLQQRNTSTFSESWFEKIWIIVPYDPEGLAEIWHNGENKENGDNNKGKKSQCFFDKCFQLKFEVPKPILTAWEKFAEDKINEALVTWNIEERKDVLEILKLTRESLNDIPTPRKIKNYINQVGLMKMHCNPKIPIKSIAYYVIQRLLKRQSVDVIREKLIKRDLPEARMKVFLDDSCCEDMAGLIFGVSPDKGHQLLLEPEIESVLMSGDSEKLKDIHENHLKAFWAVFDHYINKKDLLFEDLLTYSKVIYAGLWEEHSDKLDIFKRKVEGVISNTQEINWPDEKSVESYSGLVKILTNTSLSKSLYDRVIKALNSQIESNEQFDMQTATVVLKELVRVFDINKQQKLSSLDYSKFVSWSQASVESNIPVWQWIIPSQHLSAEISSNIVPKILIPSGVKGAFDYLVKAGVDEDWSEVLTACQQHIQHNGGVRSSNSHSPEVLEIIFTLAFGFSKYDGIVNSIVKKHEFYSFAWDDHKLSMPKIALLCGKCLGAELNKFSPTQGNSPSFAAKLREYWDIRSESNARDVLELLEKYHRWDFLWELAKDKQNKLVIDVISLALKDEKAIKLFSVNEGLQKVKSYLNLFEEDNSESVESLIRALVDDSPLEQEIIESSELGVLEYCEELFHIVCNSNNSKLITMIADKLKEQTKEAWSNSLKYDTYLTSLASSTQKKSERFGLEINYADAFWDFVKDISGKNDLTEWQSDNWEKLVSLMTEAFQKRFKSDWTEFLISHYETISDEIIDLNNSYCDYGKIIKAVDFVQSILRHSIENKNLERLKWINEYVLSTENNKKFKPKDYFVETIREKLCGLYQEQNDENNLKIIEELSGKLGIRLTTSNGDFDLEKTLVKRKWRLFFNPNAKPDASKIMSFDKDGVILEGKNNNESSWRIQNGLLELLDSNNKAHSRFSYNSEERKFSHTNDPDTGSIQKHSIRDQYMISEAI